MKIGIFSTSFLPLVGGREIVVHQLAAHLMKAGHDVTLLVPARRLKRTALPYRVWPIYGLGRFQYSFPSRMVDYFYYRQLLFAYRRLRFDVLHCHSLCYAGYYGAMLKRATNIPLVVTSHGGEFRGLPESGYASELYPPLAHRTTRVLKSADAVTCISKAIKDHCIFAGAASQKLFDIPNGLDLAWFDTPQRQRLPRELSSLRPSTRVLLSVGRSDPKKRHEDLIVAFSYLKKELEDIACVIVGRNTSSLRPLVRQLSLENEVYLLEELSDVHNSGAGPFRFPNSQLLALYKRADVFVLPSLTESFGLVLLEAMAAGLGVVATDIPGIKNFARKGKNCFLVPTRSPHLLAQAIGRLLSDKVLYAQLSAAAKNTARDYDWNDIVEKYINVYKYAVNRKKSKPPKLSAQHWDGHYQVRKSEQQSRLVLGGLCRN